MDHGRCDADQLSAMGTCRNEVKVVWVIWVIWVMQVMLAMLRYASEVHFTSQLDNNRKAVTMTVSYVKTRPTSTGIPSPKAATFFLVGTKQPEKILIFRICKPSIFWLDMGRSFWLIANENMIAETMRTYRFWFVPNRPRSRRRQRNATPLAWRIVPFRRQAHHGHPIRRPRCNRHG